MRRMVLASSFAQAREYTNFEFAVDEGKGPLNPSREASFEHGNSDVRRMRGMPKLFCRTIDTTTKILRKLF